MRSFKKYILESNSKTGYHDSSIYLSRSYLRELPDLFLGVDIGGMIDLSNNQLTSCKNFPRFVAGEIIISSNKIESLEGLPYELNGSLYIDFNKLKNLKGMPQKIYGLQDISIEYNKLESLEGFPPDTPTRRLYLNNNNLKNLIGSPTKVYGSLHIAHNPLESLDGFPEYVEDHVYVSKDSIFSEEDIKKVCSCHSVRIYDEYI
jgi:hypothetical protein